MESFIGNRSSLEGLIIEESIRGAGHPKHGGFSISWAVLVQRGLLSPGQWEAPLGWRCKGCLATFPGPRTISLNVALRRITPWPGWPSVCPFHYIQEIFQILQYKETSGHCIVTTNTLRICISKRLFCLDAFSEQLFVMRMVKKIYLPRWKDWKLPS